VAGTRIAMALRQRGYVGDIRVLEAEEVRPYDKPPLSKEVIEASTAAEPPELLPQELADSLNLNVELGVEVTQLSPRDNTVVTAEGEVIPYKTLIIATGSRPRQLPGGSDLPGVYTLRTRDDAINIREALTSDPSHVVVIGAGFIGSEFAAVARQRGHNVTIIEAMDIPMSHLFGPEVGKEVSSIHALNGTEVHAGARFARFVGDHRVEGIELEDGRYLPAELVVVGIGVVPNVDWLQSSEIPLDNGIPVDEDFRVEGQNNIYAIGDIALRTHPLLNIRTRIEHWTNAGEQAEELAAVLTNTSRRSPQLPYVWSDQYGSRFQIIGRPSMGELTYRYGDVASGAMFALYADAKGQPIGAVAFNDNKAITRFRKCHKKNGTAEELVAELTPTL